MSDTANEIVRRQEALAADRTAFESQWLDAAEYCLPRQNGSNKYEQQGQRRTEKLLDSTGPVALDRFAAAWESVSTPRAQRWHSLASTSERANRKPAVKGYFEELTDTLFNWRYAPRANYASQQHEVYMSVGAFGTGALLIEDAAADGIRYRAINVWELYLAENGAGVIDEVYRRFMMTAKAAVGFFAGQGELPESIQRAAEREPFRQFEFLHCVRPNASVQPGRRDAAGMAFESHYVSIEGKALCGSGGFRTFPYSITRYVTAPREVYGRSVAMMAMPDIKTLNEMRRDVLLAAQIALRPPLLLSDDGVLTPNLLPAGLNVGGIDQDGRQRVQPLVTGQDIPVTLEMMQEVRSAIRETFLIALFLTAAENPGMTATEVLQRAQERNLVLGPMLGRQHSEGLGPMIDRELDIHEQYGRLPPMPRELRESGGEYKVIYQSPLNRAQRSEEALGIVRTLEMIAPLAQADPSVIRRINSGKALEVLAEVNGVPAGVIRSDDEMEEIEAAADEQAQMQQLMQAAGPLAQGAQAVKSMAEAERAVKQGQRAA